MKFYHFILLCLFVTLSACGDDKDCDETFNFQSEVQTELNAIISASQAYSQDPSTANCNAFKDAYRDYINALGDLQDCANEIGQGAEFQQALRDAEDDLDDLVC